MDKLTAQAKERGEKAMVQLPNDVVRLAKICDELAKGPAEIEKDFAADFEKNSSGVNEKLMKLKTVTVQETLSAVKSLKDLSTLITLLVPEIHDGGNFGVGIQLQALKTLKETREGFEKFLEEPTSYHEKRAGFLEKVVEKTSMESKTSNVLESIEKEKTGTSKSESTTVSKPFVLEDSKEAIVALDVKFYCKCQAALSELRDSLLFVGDFIKKNESKIRTPRSSGGGYGY
mmetsp:Transcript_13440/g.16702  ORF Transcript_13440/g.16702 Transcript_13440/m.16702 type:complete len:231 (-) Transcript_13440:139-831(-)